MKLWPRRRAVPIENKSSLSVPDDDLLALFTGLPSVAGTSRADALAVPAVSSAIRLISEAVATLEMRVMEIDAVGGAVERADHPVARLLNDEANDWTSGFALIRDLVAEALTRDYGGLAWVNRANGRPVEIIKYDPGPMAVTYKESGEPQYTLYGRPVDRADVIHVEGPFRRSPLTMAMAAITVAAVMERHANNLFSKGAKPSGVLETPKSIGDKGISNMLKGWRAAHEGADNAGKTAVLFDGTTFKPMTLTSADAQFLELRKFQNIEIARAFRVPPSMLFELDRATWSNSEQMGKEFLSYTLEPWLKSTEAALRRALFSDDERPRFRVMFDRDDLTRADMGARATAYSSLIAARVINPNQARAWEKLPPYSGGDAYQNPNITTPAKEPANG